MLELRVPSIPYRYHGPSSSHYYVPVSSEWRSRTTALCRVRPPPSRPRLRSLGHRAQKSQYPSLRSGFASTSPGANPGAPRIQSRRAVLSARSALERDLRECRPPGVTAKYADLERSQRDSRSQPYVLRVAGPFGAGTRAHDNNSSHPSEPSPAGEVVGLCGQGDRHGYFRITEALLKDACTRILGLLPQGAVTSSPLNSLAELQAISGGLRRQARAACAGRSVASLRCVMDGASWMAPESYLPHRPHSRRRQQTPRRRPSQPRSRRLPLAVSHEVYTKTMSKVT